MSEASKPIPPAAGEGQTPNAQAAWERHKAHAGDDSLIEPPQAYIAGWKAAWNASREALKGQPEDECTGDFGYPHCMANHYGAFQSASRGVDLPELEDFLRKEAAERKKAAQSRRGYAAAGKDLTKAERKDAHKLAERMAGRKLPVLKRGEEQTSSQIQERIAAKLDAEAETLLRWAASLQEAQALRERE